MIVGLLALVGGAWAVPLVHDGGDAAALQAAVSERTGLPADQLEPVDLKDLLNSTPATLGGAVIRRCAGDKSDNGAIRAALSRAETAWREQDPLTAQDQLDLAVAHMGCLGELVEKPVAARVFQLRGCLAARAGQDDIARGELRSAFSLVDGLAWRDGDPEVCSPLFDEVAQALPTANLAVLPGRISSGPWLDGHEVPAEGAEVGEGLHLAQYASSTGLRSAWLVVASDARLVIPEAYRRPVLEKMAEPEQRGVVEALLAASLSDFQAAYVAHQGGIWLVTQVEGELTTEELVAAAPPEPEEDGKKGKKGKKKKR